MAGCTRENRKFSVTRCHFFCGVASFLLLPLQGLWGLNSGHQAFMVSTFTPEPFLSELSDPQSSHSAFVMFWLVSWDHFCFSSHTVSDCELLSWAEINESFQLCTASKKQLTENFISLTYVFTFSR